MIPFLANVGQFFSRKEILPSCDSYIIAGCERDVEEAKKQPFAYDSTQQCLIRLLWALVHSKRPEEVKRGIEMVQSSLPWTSAPLQKRDRFYLLAVGYYKTREYSKCRDHLQKCLEITPDWMQALTLEKKALKEDRKGLGLGFSVLCIVMTVTSIIAKHKSRKE
ncbi:mitochondrial fission 1 protein A-like [Vicia villosa]|uniref:mitochondrial fission 1 protein A-like n=1 Tax=Vicia villosa TaxID=3911 RepID=UPI00273AD49C|nr:mitochondrial fission 1 protein A-like [Vicia villosa]